MAADVVVGVDLAVLGAHHDDLLAGDAVEHVVAYLGQARDVVDVEPLLGDDALEVEPENLVVAIERLFEGEAGLLPGDQLFERDSIVQSHAIAPPRHLVRGLKQKAALGSIACQPPRRQSCHVRWLTRKPQTKSNSALTAGPLKRARMKLWIMRSAIR